MKLKIYLILFLSGSFIRLFADDTYTNPVLAVDVPDPTVIHAADGYFYVIATNSYLPPVYKSKDLVNWSFVRRAFTPTGRPSWESDGGIWAPDINYINGKYVLYYSMSVWNGIQTCGIGIAVAGEPEGPYTDWGKLFRSNEIGVTNSIDPNYYEENGKKYLIWGSYGGGIWIIELNDDGLSLKEGSEKIQIAGTNFEGTYIHKKGEYYYLFASTGTCCDGVNSNYRLVVGRSTSLTGTYLNKAGQKMSDNKYSLVIVSNTQFKGTGHCSEIVVDDAGDDWILYHAYQASNPEVGRVLLLSRIKWDEAGWPYVDNHTPALSAPKPVFKDPDSQQIIDIISSEDNQTVFYSQADRKIRYNGWDGSPGSLSIYSTQGEQICLFRNTKAEEWDVSYLKQGIYIVKIHKKDKFITKKIVIF